MFTTPAEDLRERVRLALAGTSARETPLEGRRASAVMLLLHRQSDGDEHVLFQLRTHLVAHHKGEISLPGGARDPEDESLLHTALRETHEEIGIPPDAVEVLGALDDDETFVSNYRITPYVGAVAPGVDPAATAPREVRELLTVPLPHLLSEDARAWKVVDQQGRAAATPAYRHGEHLIWGATARIVTSFLGRLDPALTAWTRETP